MADKRITDVDFLDSLNGDESFFVNQNNSIKQINKNNVVFGVINGGTGATDGEDACANIGAARVEYVDEQINKVETYINEQIESANTKTTTISLFSDGWSENKQTVDVDIITENNIVLVSPSTASYIAYIENEIRCVAQGDKILTFQCESTPSMTLTVNISVIA